MRACAALALLMASVGRGGAEPAVYDDMLDVPEAKVHYLDESNFERLTQAATGATTGPWLVSFCNAVDYECKRLKRSMPKVATALLEDAEEKGTIAVNVAMVDVDESPWLAKRFGLQHVPSVLFFRHGVMYYFQQPSFSVEKLVRFAQSGFARSGRSQVPPEPHVADSHERTFLVACAAVALVSGGLYIVDLMLTRSRAAKRRREREERARGR